MLGSRKFCSLYMGSGKCNFCMWGSGKCIFLYVGVSKMIFLCVFGSQNFRPFGILRSRKFVCGGLENAIFCVLVSQKSFLCIWGGLESAIFVSVDLENAFLCLENSIFGIWGLKNTMSDVSRA